MKDILPLVSICIPAYNAEATIHETLNSVIHQTYQNLEILVCDNASTDRTLEKVNAISDPRIVIYKSETNIGAEANFNRCIQLVKGKYTAIFHADDVYEINMVEKQTLYLESHSAVGAVFTEAFLIDSESHLIGSAKIPHKLYNKKKTVELDFQSLLKSILLNHNFLICPSAMLRTEINQNEICRWRLELFDSSSDLDVWFRVAEHHQIGILLEPLMRYRMSNTHYTHVITRTRTEKADFFLVMDYYLEKAQPLLNSNDLRHYGWLERSDRIARAMNLFLGGQRDQAKKLLYGLFSWDAFIAALNSKRGLRTLLLGSVLKITILFHLDKIGKAAIIRIRKITRK